MSFRLEIEGQTANIGNEIIALSKKGFDISNLANRGIQISNRINLPFTQENHKIFNSAYVINSDNNYMDKYFKAKILDNFFIFNGVGFISKINNNYQFQLVEKSKEFFDNLEKSIKELDFESNDITFNYTDYGNYKLLSNSIWVWPAVCMHEDKQSSILDGNPSGLKYSRPMFRFKTILDKIFEENKWSITYDQTIINNFAISSNHDKFFVTSYQKTLDATIAVTVTHTLTGLNTNDFENNVTTTNTTIDIGSVITTFRLRGAVSVDSDFYIILKANDGAAKITEQRFYINQNTTEIDIFTDKFETDDANNYVEIILEGTGNFEFDNVYLYTLIDESDFDDLNTNPLLNYRVKVHDNLPEKSQYQIFKEAVLFTNSVINPDSLNKSIELNSLKILSKLYNENWSDKYVEDSDHKPGISSKLGNYAQKNWLKYNNDHTINQYAGSDYFNINSEILKDETDLITFPYSASIDIEISTYEMAHFNIYGYNDTDSVYEKINSLNERIVYVYNDPTDTFTLGRFVELEWKNMRVYWNSIFESLYRPRFIDAEFNLKSLDFYNFNFLRTVYIEKLKSNFIVLNIDDFRTNELTKCQLLKFK